MTKEERELLIKDLCARLPYGVMYETPSGTRVLNDIFIYSNGPVYTDHAVGEYNQIYGIELLYIKPYLRPMSSMTKEERAERIRILWEFEGHIDQCVTYKYQDWLNSHHFDYRGLIPMGLALEAPEGMYKTE